MHIPLMVTPRTAPAVMVAATSIVLGRPMATPWVIDHARSP
jgi:hypothetical protein